MNRHTSNAPDLRPGRWVLLVDPELEELAGPLVVSDVSTFAGLTALSVYDPDSVVVGADGHLNPLVSATVLLNPNDPIVIV